MKIVAVVYGDFAKFLSKISPFTRLKTLFFGKSVTVVYGVFAQFLSEISPFVLFLDKKQPKKDDLPSIKKRYIL